MIKLARSTYSGELLVHKDIWRAAAMNAEKAAEQERGSYYFDLSSLLLTACALEGYANYLISIIDPAVYENERSIFAGDVEFAGTKGKLLWIANRAGLDLVNHSGYAITCEVLALRHELAHCKPQRYQFYSDHPIDKDPPMFPPKSSPLSERMKRLAKAEAMQAIEKMADALHQAVSKIELLPEERLRFLPCAFAGLTKMETVHSSLIEPRGSNTQ